MTEKEFLLEFINEIEALTDIVFHKEETERGIDLFLEAHHKEYFEVEFEKIPTKEEIEEAYQKGLRGEVIPTINMTLDEIKKMYKENA